MTLKELANMFHRSLERVFDIQKFLPIFLVLLFSGLLFLFCQGFATHASAWMHLPLLSVPFYVLGFLLMVVGAGIIQSYENEKQGKIFKGNLYFSKECFLKAVYFFGPLLGALILVSILFGIIVLIKSIAYLGTFLGIILAFAPYLFNFCFLLLLLAACLALFFFTPLLSLKQKIDKQALIARLNDELFTHLILLIVALFPLWIIAKFAIAALVATLVGYSSGDAELIKILQGLFILIPIAALLTFPLIFFFHFASEAYSYSSSKKSH